MNRLKGLLLASTLIASSAVSASAEVNVVASIKPIHSLVAAVMEGVGEPGLIVEGAGSPHTYALKPSQAQMLEQANLVFWVGHELEAFLEKPLETVGANAKSIELIDADDLVKLGFREGGAFDKHDHGDEAGHDDHAHEAEAKHDHAHEKTAEAEHDHAHEKTAEAGHEGHDHGAFDAHVWLDPVNAKAMVHEIEEALVEADPGNAAKYEANAEAVTARLDALIAEVSAELEPVKGKGFIVFHDAYQYFENRFGVTASGSITVSPEVMPGAARITEIRARVQELGAACVFAEPQFEPKLVSTVIEGTQAKAGIIDPLGAELEGGSDLYFEVIRNMATSIKTCLSQAS
ncbi:MAG: zinc ABC transporter substrate-binding protein ZnuA [Hoeflea sp.]|uniref:zinc ABC transporter substrate-binding protein ZnuA n=1 Tax=Hoeflea sp. TaxID=1940281 RepID=UPI001D95F9DA|nr:zinc ABC transporter substrate-binding protein ZnuA [Hoeflea sp.]MBU4531959.1 zinc ABC transporter substrate-binding protein ZnuA [Alphaproteobacteria bacterium]MBU4546381.1 zinc ABC transporter substrate-binding protein ZnuA [Alphaproteobacteria bacterium]MBU4549510.1 zinc ABC transporter substrate-binding protein ZnuA [Alphaproteobacteria bacterium]MBV1722685.1 zinc ABC transporter substrate-binding protein ZnuA [Hoeflea sp.]MBV1782624.1 zinc ABC transporter substrate-binding protein ZnuA